MTAPTKLTARPPSNKGTLAHPTAPCLIHATRHIPLNGGAFLLAKEYDRHISGYEDRQHTILQESDCPAGPGCRSPDHAGRKGPLPQAVLEQPSGEIFHWQQLSHDLGCPLPCSWDRVSSGGKETQNAPGPGIPVRARRVETARIYGCRRWIWQEGRS